MSRSTVRRSVQKDAGHLPAEVIAEDARLSGRRRVQKALVQVQPSEPSEDIDPADLVESVVEFTCVQCGKQDWKLRPRWMGTPRRCDACRTIRERKEHNEAIRAGMRASAARGTHVGRPRAAVPVSDADLAAIIASSSSMRIAWRSLRERTDADVSWSTFWRRSRELKPAAENVSPPRWKPGSQGSVRTTKKALKASAREKRASTKPQDGRNAKESSPSTRRRAGDPVTVSEYLRWPADRQEVWGRCSHGFRAKEFRFQRADGSEGVWSRSHLARESIGMFAVMDQCDGTFTPGSKGSPRGARS